MKDPIIIPSLITEWCEFYAGTCDAADPRISPLRGDLASLPPIVMHSAVDDLLAVDADNLERQIAMQIGIGRSSSNEVDDSLPLNRSKPCHGRSLTGGC
ncbi:alpha/beta hydrolase fold domain-containing protein [Mycobacterium sp. 852002-10029_SCH5224772]|uniref:alpha/beta hydrolase fold domain-containing protein n=1 Tax=Mycobacterium sp. 852002-10029_SCH5224772 TaxID=1834083 RepID=UPI0007FFB4B3|nr:alpha/beta hydrolase fold domain-containing protein [Mycobacterium sp. 852002-10029_SCH5224772]OBF10742.1 hypothetical protein A5775_17515 [Mycobacterium sp. 852002-10029_SCH5224772]